MQVMQTEDNTAGMRAAIFFLSLVFILSQLCVNVSLLLLPSDPTHQSLIC